MEIKEITGDNFQTEVTKAAQPVLLEFYADVCSFCKAQLSVLEEAAEEAVPSEAAKPEETQVTAPTVEVAHPEEKSVVPAWLKEIWQQLFPADAPASSEPEPVSSEEVLPASEAALPPEETETEPETEGAAE